MQLTLVLPSLLDATPEALAAVDAPVLSRLLWNAPDPIPESDGPVAVECARLGITKQDDWPAAPLLARAAGIDPGVRYWLCAEPVTLEIGRDQGRLAGAVADLDTDESAALLASLRAHFGSDGVEFVERGAGRWWLSLAQPQRLEASPPDAALGKPLAAHLPRGPDAARWRRWQSEMQMLLFKHPVNRTRESGGRPPVNYLWIWGGGTLRGIDRPASHVAVFTQAPLVRDLAKAAGAEVQTLPGSFAEFRSAPLRASTLVWLDRKTAPALPVQLATFDADWAAPLERAIDSGELDATVVIAGTETALSFKPRARGTLQRLRQRWSSMPSLSTLLAARADANVVGSR